MIFLGYNKIDIKQKLSALDINGLWSKEMWSLSYVTLMTDILFLDVPTIKIRTITILLTN